MRLKYVYTEEEKRILRTIMYKITNAWKDLIEDRKRLDKLQAQNASVEDVMNANRWVWRDYYQIDALLDIVNATHGISTYEMRNRLMKYVLHGRTK